MRGNPQFGTAYRGVMYFCASEDALVRFLATPWRFVGLRMPHKVPPPDEPLAVQELASAHGYLEQSMGAAVRRAGAEKRRLWGERREEMGKESGRDRGSGSRLRWRERSGEEGVEDGREMEGMEGDGLVK